MGGQKGTMNPLREASMNTNYYILDGKTPVAIDIEKNARTYMEGNRRILRTETRSGHLISTVFLQIDHNFNEQGPPVLFETMIFKDGEGYHDLYCRRFSNYDDAITNHLLLLEQICDSGIESVLEGDPL